VIAPSISFLLLYDVFIQGVANKRTIGWKSAPKFRLNWEFLLSMRVVKVRLLEQKQLNIDVSIFLDCLEFDVDSQNRIKNYKFGLLLKFGTPYILMEYLGIKFQGC